MRIETKAKLDYLQETKSLIKTALNEKGIAISDTDTFRSFADSIRNAEFKSDDVRYVTFMNGEATLYVKPVATGDDCVNVLTKGLITTPKKESTVDKVFTYSGWAATEGGEVDENVLKAVTENKSVYAAYTEAVRYYTITYYDSDGTTVLKTESLAYGSTPAYTPAKDGFNFEGWTPSPATVKDNATYTATWSEKLTFAGASWADIARISEAGEAADYFKVGDTRNIALLNGDTITVAVAGFDHDDLADGSGKAGLSIVCMTVPNYLSPWTTNGNNTSSAFYSASHTTARTTLNPGGTVYGYIPEDLKAVIKPVIKKSDKTGNGGTGQTLAETSDTLWLLSIDELGCTQPSLYPRSCSVLGSRYELFAEWNANGTNGVKRFTPSVNVASTGNKASSYWTRHSQRVGVFSPIYMQYTSSYGGDTNSFKNASQATLTDTQRYLRFGFCI